MFTATEPQGSSTVPVPSFYREQQDDFSTALSGSSQTQYEDMDIRIEGEVSNLGVLVRGRSFRLLLIVPLRLRDNVAATPELLMESESGRSSRVAMLLHRRVDGLLIFRSERIEQFGSVISSWAGCAKITVTWAAISRCLSVINPLSTRERWEEAVHFRPIDLAL